MNWDAIGAIGEIVGAIAVLATLIYLAQQIHQSNRIALRNSRVDALEFAGETVRYVIENPQHALLMKKLRFGEELTDLEQESAIWLATQYMAFWGGVLNASIDARLMSEQSIHTYRNSALNTVRDYPGLAPFILRAFRSAGIEKGKSGPVIDAVLTELDK